MTAAFPRHCEDEYLPALAERYSAALLRGRALEVMGPVCGTGGRWYVAPKVGVSWNDRGWILAPDLYIYPDGKDRRVARLQWAVEVKWLKYAAGQGGAVIFDEVVEQMRDLLTEYRGRVLLFIVSGAFPEDPRVMICNFRRMPRFVVGCDGRAVWPGLEDVPEWILRRRAMFRSEPVGWVPWSDADIGAEESARALEKALADA